MLSCSLYPTIKYPCTMSNMYYYIVNQRYMHIAYRMYYVINSIIMPIICNADGHTSHTWFTGNATTIFRLEYIIHLVEIVLCICSIHTHRRRHTATIYSTKIYAYRTYARANTTAEINSKRIIIKQNYSYRIEYSDDAYGIFNNKR